MKEKEMNVMSDTVKAKLLCQTVTLMRDTMKMAKDMVMVSIGKITLLAEFSASKYVFFWFSQAVNAFSNFKLI